MSNSCFDNAHKNDPDKFLLSLMVPAKHRPAIWAVLAFNHEIAKTREVVSETTIGLIRLQWWRDAIKEIYEGQPPRKHHVVEPLAKGIKQYNLPQEWFDQLIYAREFDLEDVVPADLKGLYNYCDYTTTSLFQIILKICEYQVQEEVIRNIATRYARIGIVRSTAFLFSQRRMMLPQEILKKHNLSAQQIFDFNKFENLPQVIHEVLNDKKLFRNDQSIDDSTFLKAANKMIKLYETQLKSVHYDVLDPKLQIQPKFMALRVWLSTKF